MLKNSTWDPTVVTAVKRLILNIFSNWLPYSRADTATVKLNGTLLQIMATAGGRRRKKKILIP